MKTKKANVNMIIEMEEKAFNELIDSTSKNKLEAEGIKFKVNNVYYESPEIQSISNVKINELKENNNTFNGIEKRDFDNYTVGEVMDILSKFPSEYEFLCCGESDYAIWVDHNSGMVSIDRRKFIDEMMQNIKEYINREDN